MGHGRLRLRVILGRVDRQSRRRAVVSVRCGQSCVGIIPPPKGSFCSTRGLTGLRPCFPRGMIPHGRRTPSKMSTYLHPFNTRPLSTFERLLWLHDQAEPTHFSVSGLIEGATTVEEWKMALAALQRRHPLFRVSIQTDENGLPFFREEAEAPIPLRVVECNAEQQLEQEVATEIATPFYSAATAPLVRAAVLHEKKRSIVILVAHHSIADGISLAYAIRDLVRALAGKALEPLPVPPSHEDLLGLAEDPAESATSGAKASINPEFFRLVPRVASLRLSRESTANLRERAQQEGTSVHGALLASIVFAAKELGDGERSRAVEPGFSTQHEKSAEPG